MFCSNCGKQINDKAKFCKYCGYTVSDDSHEDIIVKNEHNQQLNTVFNRDVLNNYLYNIRTLEFYCSKLSNDKLGLEGQISKLGIRRVSDNVCSPIDSEDIGFCLIGAGIVFVVGLIAGWLKNTWVGDFFEIEGFLGGLSVFAIVISVLAVIGMIIYCVVSTVNNNERHKTNLNEDINRVNSELKEKEILKKQLTNVVDEISNAENLRTEAYSLNIIPSKYRNIYAAYFLYDFISTSTASLNEALLHCDLDTIQQQLETVIKQQEEIIMELARANALNERFVVQNEQILNHAIQTENNTALAAQYSKAAAVNTSITACIQLSEYLKP